jgi:hypothetical protein
MRSQVAGTRHHPGTRIVRRSPVVYLGVFFTLSILGTGLAAYTGWTPKPVKDDALVRLLGSQPQEGVALESPDRCLNCHAGYDRNVEPGFNWIGSMMAQAARDPIFFACLTTAAQDAIWAVGNPNATDLCLRCHFPEGWLEGRSDPTNASLMTGSDFDGLHCDFCHRMFDPFAPTTFDGTREGSDWMGYWDEKGNTGPGSQTLSQTEAATTYHEDLLQQSSIEFFSGAPFFVNQRPKYAPYTENLGGQYFVSTRTEKRAGFADATARHKMLYSRHHKSRYFCATCHDVSNAVLANLKKPLPDLSGGQDLISEQYSAFRYFHVERTWSEFALSAYGRPGGAATNPEFQAQGAPTVTRAARCQDCHMRDVVGAGANKKDAPIRPTESREHPASGHPLHDLTGGNAWTSRILASLDPQGPVHDPRNVEILGQGPGVLTLDLTAGVSPSLNGAALQAGAERALAQLKLAATLQNLTYQPGTGQLGFRVLNNTAHKLISGFPEGRRMFVNIKLWADRGQTLIQEVNPYDDAYGSLRGLPGAPALGPRERHEDGLVYEAQMKSDLTGEKKKFHFVLATGRTKDNRIPPRGFDSQKAAERLCEPAWDGKSAPSYFTAAEYAGGYDQVNLSLAPGADRVEVTLYYQGTSREYVEFLRDEINGTARTLPASAYIAQTDPFFARLRAWGNAIWDLWYHNHGLDARNVRVPGIVPVKMAGAVYESALPVLSHSGNATPGGAVEFRIEGPPAAAVVLAISLVPQTASPPLTVPGIEGDLYLLWPFVLIPLGPVPAGGTLTFPLPLPASLPTPGVYPCQALVGLQLTNLDVVNVK